MGGRQALHTGVRVPRQHFPSYTQSLFLSALFARHCAAICGSCLMFQQPSGIETLSYVRGVEASPIEVKECAQGQSVRCWNLGLELELPKDALTTTPHVFLCCGLTVPQAMCFPVWALNRRPVEMLSRL